jgi:Transposase
VWAAPGRNTASLQAFFDGPTPEQKASIKAVSIDMSAGYEKAIRDSVPDAEVAFDPFHVVQLGGKAADQVRRDEYNRHGRSASGEGKWIKGTRYSLLKDTAKQTAGQLLKLAEVVLTNKRMYRAFLLLGELRYIYRVPKQEAADRLDAWLAWASRSRLKPFIKLAPHHPPTQSRRARSNSAEHQQRTPRGPQQQGETDLTPRLRIPLIRRPHRHDLPLLRRHPNRDSSPMSHPQTARRAVYADRSRPRCQRDRG